MENYVFNLETAKIELYFEKTKYNALTDEQKRILKSAFLWSNAKKAWISRAKEPNLYYAKKVARDLGFSEEERTGERLSFAEQLQRKAERAEERAERYEQYAENAEKRGEALQKPLNDMHGDIAFFTQPNINTSAGRAFANYRNKLYARFDKGMDEYRKSEYFKNRAETARATAENIKLNDLGYLERKVKELDKEARQRFKNVEKYEDRIDRIESGEVLHKISGEVLTIEELNEWINRDLELIDVASDKMAFFKNRIDELGGIRFNKNNIKPGFTVKLNDYSGRVVEVVSVGSVNITYRILTGGAAGWIGKASYAEIAEITSTKEAEKVLHPFKVGETFTVKIWKNSAFEDTVFKIIAATEKSVKLQSGENAPITRRPTQSKFSKNKWALSITNDYGGTVYKIAE